jgi:hypothetical protein
LTGGSGPATVDERQRFAACNAEFAAKHGLRQRHDAQSEMARR